MSGMRLTGSDQDGQFDPLTSSVILAYISPLPETIRAKRRRTFTKIWG